MFLHLRSAAATDDFALQAHPDAKPFRDRSFPLYNDLACLCESVIATGNNVVAAGPRRSRTAVVATQVSAPPSGTSSLSASLATSSPETRSSGAEASTTTTLCPALAVSASSATRASTPDIEDDAVTTPATPPMQVYTRYNHIRHYVDYLLEAQEAVP